ncbi:MAG: hypothetical protein RL660_1018 [Bacteroidota bacterium]|jgi:hypothetical protein
MRLKLLFAILLVLCIYLPTQAQYNFFTQNLNSGITLNPAKAGVGEHNMRTTVILNSYSYGASDILQPCIFASLDAKLFKHKKKLQISGGCLFNKQGFFKRYGMMHIWKAGLCIGLSKKFGKRHQQFISFGSTFSLNSMELAYTWQFTQLERYCDFDLGVLYGLRLSKRTEIVISAALQHQRPKYLLQLPPFSDNIFVPINTRNAQLQVNYKPNKRILAQASIVLHAPSVFNKATSQRIAECSAIFDFSVGKQNNITPKTIVQLGLYARRQRHISPYFGFRAGTQEFGFSYDLDIAPFYQPWLSVLPISNLELSYNCLLSKKNKMK